MKQFISLLGLAWLTLFSMAAERPNVIFIMADDQGSADLACYGSKDLVTPHTDALAASGVRFTPFYSASPVYSPSRAGMLTGRWPMRAGVAGNCASQEGENGALPAREITTGATNFVTITVIPEPNAAALLGGLGTLCLLRRRRN